MKPPFSWTLTSGIGGSGWYDLFFSWGLNFATGKLIKFSSFFEGEKKLSIVPFVLFAASSPALTYSPTRLPCGHNKERKINEDIYSETKLIKFNKLE